jgi:hypothetical protein
MSGREWTSPNLSAMMMVRFWKTAMEQGRLGMALGCVLVT